MTNMNEAVAPAQSAPIATPPALKLKADSLRRLGPVVALGLAIALVPLIAGSAYHMHMAVMIGIHAVIAISLNLLVGYAGQISLGHAGFMAIGAYGTAILSARYGWPPLLGLGVSSIAAGLLAFAVGRPILRLKGYYLAMATLGLGMIIYLVISNEVWLTGGPDGMSLSVLTVFGIELDSAGKWYWIVGAILLLTYWMARNLVDAPIGRALRALEGPDALAASAGIDISWNKVRIFAVSAALTALMGGVGALYSGFITPKSADFMQSIELILMVILGGMGSVFGAVVGAGIVTMLPQVLTSLEHYESLVYGVILILVMVFMPKGLVPTTAHLIRKFRR